MTDSTIIGTFPICFIQCTYFYFDRYGKLLKVLLQLPLVGRKIHGADLPSDDYWFIVNYDLDGKDKIFKSHFSLKKITKKHSLLTRKHISFKPFRNLKQSESAPIIF
jgi:gliding motility-associated-like protein